MILGRLRVDKVADLHVVRAQAVERRQGVDSRRINLKRACYLAGIFFREDKAAVHKQAATELPGVHLSQVSRVYTYLQ